MTISLSRVPWMEALKTLHASIAKIEGGTLCLCSSAIMLGVVCFSFELSCFESYLSFLRFVAWGNSIQKQYRSLLIL